MELKVSSPCPKSWDSLVGDDRVRYCGQCKLNVYNLADMSSEEVAEIVQKTEGRLCGRLYVRRDHTATVENCRKSGVRAMAQAVLAVSAVLLLGATAWGLRYAELPNRNSYPAWVQTVLNWISPQKHQLLGDISCPPPKTPPTAPAVED